MTHADSMSEVIRRAIALYDFLWIEKEAGSITLVRDSKGNEKQLHLI